MYAMWIKLYCSIRIFKENLRCFIVSLVFADTFFLDHMLTNCSRSIHVFKTNPYSRLLSSGCGVYHGHVGSSSSCLINAIVADRWVVGRRRLEVRNASWVALLTEGGEWEGAGIFPLASPLHHPPIKWEK